MGMLNRLFCLYFLLLFHLTASAQIFDTRFSNSSKVLLLQGRGREITTRLYIGGDKIYVNKNAFNAIDTISISSDDRNDTIDLGIVYLDDFPDHKNTPINNKWFGSYAGSFLRMKEESADPRGWGQIKIEIGKTSAKFHLDSYIENVERELRIVQVNRSEIKFADRDNKNLMLTIKLDKDKYWLSGNLMEQIVGIKETYELKKRK